jgi:glucosamine 6-phosphate synthetase-like amidotransferase/phosphosugar isomerase protein
MKLILEAPSKDHMYVIGTFGLGEVAAREGSLKIKELTYMHCQALKLGGHQLA